MKILKIIFLLFLQTYYSPVFSKNRIIDSLENFIKITNNDTSKAKALSNLSICEWQLGNFNRSLKHVNDAIEILNKLPQSSREITDYPTLYPLRFIRAGTGFYY